MYKNLVAIDNRIKKLMSLVLLRTCKEILDYLLTLSKEELVTLGLGEIPIQAENIRTIVDQLHLKWMFVRWQEYGINQKSFAEGESLIYVYGNPVAANYRKDFEAIYSVTEIPAVKTVFNVIDECKMTRREVCRLTWNDIRKKLDRKIREEEKIQEQERTI